MIEVRNQWTLCKACNKSIGLQYGREGNEWWGFQIGLEPLRMGKDGKMSQDYTIPCSVCSGPISHWIFAPECMPLIGFTEE